MDDKQLREHEEFQRKLERDIGLAAMALGFILGMAFVYYSFGC